MKCDSTIKRMNGVLMNATPWTNRKNIMLSKRIQTQNFTRCVIPFIRTIQNR